MLYTVMGTGQYGISANETRKSGCMTAVLLVFLLGAAVKFLQGPDQTADRKAAQPPTQQPAPAPAPDASLEFQKPEPPPTKPILKYSIARKWLPNKEPNGLGLEIVLENPDPTKQELIDLVTQISTGRDPVVLQVYATQAAYDTQKTYGDEWDRGYLLYYTKVKNGSGERFNEIRWMASAGKFADDPETREGAVTKLESGE